MSPSEPEAGARSVDFVVGEPVGPAEDEPPPRSGALWTRRGPLLVGAAVVGALLIARVAATQPTQPKNVAQHPTTQPSAADPTGAGGSGITVSRASYLPPAGLRPHVVSLDARTGAVINCPATQACTVVRGIPVGVVQAVRAEYPKASVTRVVTVLGVRDGSALQVLLQRTILVADGGTSLDIEVHEATPADEAGVSGTGSESSDGTSTYRDVVPGYVVDVVARRPGGRTPLPMQTLALVANRPGLLAT